MHHPPFMAEIGIIFGMAMGVAWLFRILRLPSILGYLFTGVIIGPAGLELVHGEEVESIAELGLILLLFTIGLELSPKPLFRMGRSLTIAFGVQSGLTILIAMLIAGGIFGLSLPSLFVIGVTVALSSTAITLKQLNDRGETDTLVGMTSTGILLLQDVLVIAVMLFLPLLALGQGGDFGGAVLRLLGGIATMTIIVIILRKAMPYILSNVVRPGGRELMALFAVVMACGGAWLAAVLGWSPALGACIAGLLLADADERHQMIADILPFRDVFNAFFFISLGMLVSVDAGVTYALPIAGFMLLTLVLKTAIVYIAVRAGGWGVRPAIQAGFGLCTVSEFGYVLVAESIDMEILPTGIGDAIIVYVFVTMMVGTLVAPATRPLIGRLTDLMVRLDPRSKGFEERRTSPRYEKHVIVVGFGMTGHNLLRVLKSTRIPFCIIEMNRGLAQEARADGVDVLVGDASRFSILRHAGIDDAHALVVAINDPEAITRVVSQARATRPDLYIVVRTRFTRDIDTLYKLGANQVIAEDFESSIELTAYVLKEMSIPDNIVEGQIAALRAGRYAMLRGHATDRTGAEELMKVLQLTATRTHYLMAESDAVGKTIAETDLRARSGATIIAVVRDGTSTTSPPGRYAVRSGRCAGPRWSARTIGAGKGLSG